MQLMELAIINGTFRTNEQVQAAQIAMAQKLQAVRKSALELHRTLTLTPNPLTLALMTFSFSKYTALQKYCTFSRYFLLNFDAVHL